MCSLHDEPSPRTPCPKSAAVDEFGLPEIPGESCSASSVKLPREKLEAQAKSTASTALPGGQRELKAIAKKPAHADIAEDNLALSTKSFGLVKVAGGSKRSYLLQYCGESWFSILNITEKKDPNHKALAARILEYLTTHKCKHEDLVNLRDSWALSEPDKDEPPSGDDEPQPDNNEPPSASSAFGFFSSDTMGGGFL